MTQQLKRNKQLFDSLANGKLPGVDVDLYDPLLDDLYIPGNRQSSIYAHPWLAAGVPHVQGGQSTFSWKGRSVTVSNEDGNNHASTFGPVSQGMAQSRKQNKRQSASPPHISEYVSKKEPSAPLSPRARKAAVAAAAAIEAEESGIAMGTIKRPAMSQRDIAAVAAAAAAATAQVWASMRRKDDAEKEASAGRQSVEQNIGAAPSNATVVDNSASETTGAGADTMDAKDSNDPPAYDDSEGSTGSNGQDNFVSATAGAQESTSGGDSEKVSQGGTTMPTGTKRTPLLTPKVMFPRMARRMMQM